ncbi:hypothetical protein ARMSODRAFT_1028366 [Armillaria solidipes]|uniref:Uncharacterized protein n=1 Tax=Armillaria solidipes TaxID=1076256 RepID=A0A2H3AHC1_9AGAR|nr:hypothetical protein ARMSODRAFT_1028366 [Armillaria solidipes]
MSQTPEPKDHAAVAARALGSYEMASKLLEHKVDFPPDDTQTSKEVDEWVAEVHKQWSFCHVFWERAGIKQSVWNDLEESYRRYNELVERALKYKIRKIHLIPSRSPSPVQGSHISTPTPLVRSQKPKTPPPPPSKQRSAAPTTPPRGATKPTPDLEVPVHKLNLTAASPATSTLTTSRIQAPVKAVSSSQVQTTPRPPAPNTAKQTGQQAAPLQKTATPTGRAEEASFFYEAQAPRTSFWGIYWSSSAKWRRQLGVGFTVLPMIPSLSIRISPRPYTRSRANSTRLVRQPRLHAPRRLFNRHPRAPFAVNAPDRSNVVPGPDPGLRTDSTISHYPDNRTSLFFPGTDDEEEMIREDLVDGEQVAGTDGEDGGFQRQDDDTSTPSKDGPMDVDKDEGQQSDDASSPPPTQSRRKNHRISFVFDDATGDFQDPYPTIFLPRRPVPQDQNPRCSTRPRTSPTGPDTAYLQVVQGSKPESKKKKKKKDVKAKFKETEGPIPRKRSRDEEGAPAIEKRAPKKLKSTATTVDDAKVARPSKAVRKRGPAPSKPPAVTMRVSGGGFGEKVPVSAKEVENGIKCIGVLAVDRDFRDFVEVDKAYWNKEVAAFVVYTEGCDHCKRLGTQCRKFLTNTVICVCCHYSKLPCKVNGIAALNPVSHYRPNGYKNLNAFERALDTLAQHADSLEDQIIGYMAGINALTQLNGLRVQAGRLCECAIYNKGSDKDNNSDGDGDDEDEGIAEGVAGPSKKKAKSG